jgi:hypothetical protein
VGAALGFGLVTFSGHEATDIRSVVGGEDRRDAISLVVSAERREAYGQIYLVGGSAGNRDKWERCGKNQLCLAAAPFRCRNQGETVQTATLCGCIPCMGEGKLQNLERKPIDGAKDGSANALTGLLRSQKGRSCVLYYS